MSQQSAAITRLALRELWISFRLLVLLVGFVGAGVAVALLPGAFAVRVERLVLGATAASVLAGAVAGWSLAVERHTGRAGWLVARSVPRGTLVAGWFVGIAGTTLAGLATTATLGWLALPVGGALEPARFALAMGVLAAAALAWVALGLLAGSVGAPAPAAFAVLLVAALLVGAALVGIGPDLAGWLMTGATVAELLRLLGGLLGLAGVLLAGGHVAMGRVEL